MKEITRYKFVIIIDNIIGSFIREFYGAHISGFILFSCLSEDQCRLFGIGEVFDLFFRWHLLLRYIWIMLHSSWTINHFLLIFITHNKLYIYIITLNYKMLRKSPSKLKKLYKKSSIATVTPQKSRKTNSSAMRTQSFSHVCFCISKSKTNERIAKLDYERALEIKLSIYILASICNKRLNYIWSKLK